MAQARLRNRHSRRTAFERAIEANRPAMGHWTAIAQDPNDPAALAERARVLAAAWRPSIGDRIEFLRERCDGRRVLDIGCVAHDVRRLGDRNWLHAHLVEVSAECVGVDVEREGVESLRSRGYDVVHHDLGTGMGPLRDRAPFDVIIAGEVIEHVSNLDMLFDASRQLLADDGQLILSTPNPYSPRRVLAGQRGIVWENVDHVVYAFPSGIAELASRHGLALTEAADVQPRTSGRSPRRLAQTTVRWLRGAAWRSAGYETAKASATRHVTTPKGWHLRSAGRRFTGETFVYVVRRFSTTGVVSR